MKFLKNLKIKSKLRIPIILQLILLLIFGYFFFTISSRFSAEKKERQIVTKTANQIRLLSNSIDDFLHQKGTHTLEQVTEEHSRIMKTLSSNTLFRNTPQIKSFKEVLDDLTKLDELFKSNNNIEKEIFQLTDLSIKQSNDFIGMLSRKLAHPTQRTGVSTLERAVIAGASVNTTTNFQLKVLFLQTKQDPTKGDGLMAFIDQLIQNVENDIKRLTGTPFLGMAQTAKDANLKIKELCTTFLANLKNVTQLEGKIMANFDNVFQYITHLEEQNSNAIFETVNSVFLKLFIILIVMTLIIIILSHTLTRWILHPLHAMLERAYDLAVGDVDMTSRIDVESKDELGELAGWFNKFLERLQDLIKKVRDGSKQVYSATEDIRRSSEELASRTNQQAASITETSATVEQFTSATRINTESSAEADMMLVQFNSEIQEKSGLIDNVTSTMTEIFDSSKQIDNIIKVINDISFQTNLLALNAAVEAARAGEAGRGFAVVASEVRNLAQKTAESSKSIQDIVIRNVESTQKGMELVKATSEFFGEVVGVMSDIVTKISEITNVSREQTTGLEQINLAIGQMDQVSNQNADLVQQLHNTGKSVEANAIELQRLVEQFKVDQNSTIKGSDYFNEVGNKKENKTKKKDKKKNKPDKGKEKSTPQAVQPKDTKRKEPPVTKPVEVSSSPTEDDFFGNDDDGFEEF